MKAGAAMKLHLEDMTSLLTSHGLQGVDTRGDRDDNNEKQLQMDTSDNIDGKHFHQIKILVRFKSISLVYF